VVAEERLCPSVPIVPRSRGARSTSLRVIRPEPVPVCHLMLAPLPSTGAKMMMMKQMTALPMLSLPPSLRYVGNYSRLWDLSVVVAEWCRGATEAQRGGCAEGMPFSRLALAHPLLYSLWRWRPHRCQ